jgi:uncharacterized membrane protein (DUF2068 family)
MQNNPIAKGISIYKMIMNMGRIIFSFLVLYYSCNIHNLLNTIKKINFFEIDVLAQYLSRYLNETPDYLTLMLIIPLLVLSAAEIFLVIGLIKRQRWSAIGLFITSILWIPLEILFISKFLIASKIVTISLDLIIMYLLYRLLRNSHHYFKEVPKS